MSRQAFASRWRLAAAGLLLLAGAALFLTPAASADVNITGDWVISTPLFYANQVINVTNTTESDGNVTITATGELHLANCTFLMPYGKDLQSQGLVVAANSTFDGPSWFFSLRGVTDLRSVNIFNASYDRGAGFSGTYLNNPNLVLQNIVWNQTNGEVGTIHLRVRFNFTGHTLGYGSQLSIELPPLSTAANIQIYNNRFAHHPADTTNAIFFADQLHTAPVTFDIHHNSFAGGGNGVFIRDAPRTTTFLVHDNDFSGIPGTALTIGEYTIGAPFNGTVALWNLSIADGGSGIRFSGFATEGVSGTIDNVTIMNVTNGIYANEATWFVRNSTVTLSDPQYSAGTGGVILIYDTTDVALNASASGTGARVEHFVFLNLAGVTWQSGIPLLGDNLTLLDPAGNVSLTVNAAGWTPRLVVWWGRYGDGTFVDSRDLRPTIVDGGRSFNCTPAQFFVTVGMSSVSVVCTDDAAPDITATAPAEGSYQNATSILGAGRVVELGAGLQTLEWSIDNFSFVPATIIANTSTNFTLATGALLDGMYTVFIRATDRVGNARVITRGPVTVDTVAPPLGIGTLPVFVTGASFTISGNTEPFARVTVVRTGGWNATLFAAADGSFSMLVPVEEGANTYTVTVRDLAGNAYSLPAETRVDTVAPALVVKLNGAISTTALTADPLLGVDGLAEVGAVVTVNGQVATRSADSFTAELALAPGLTNITVHATDTAGNIAVWFGIAYFDNAAPVLTLSAGVAASPDGILRTRSASVSLSGTVRDAGTSVTTFTVNGQAYVPDGAGGFQITFPVGEGENNITVAASDMVGNTVTRTLTIVKDTTAPQATTALRAVDSPLSVQDGVTYTRGSSVTVALQMSEAGTATVGDTVIAVVKGANNVTVALVEGSNVIPVEFADLAGNAGAPSTLGIVRDTTPPAIQVSSILPDEVLDDEHVELVGTAEPLAVVHVNGEPVTVSALGEFRKVIALTTGANAIEINASDALGNQNSTTISVTRRAPTTAPVQGFDMTLGILLLVVGLAAGAGIGMVLGRPKGAARDESAPASTEAAEPRAAGPAPPPGRPSGPRAPGPAPPPPRTKGPRGPQPPGTL